MTTIAAVTVVRLLEGLGTMLLFFAPGAGLAALLLGPRVRGAYRLACAYLLGLAWVAGGLYALSHLFSVPIRRTAVLALVLPPALVGIVAAIRHRRTRVHVRRFSPLVAIACTAAAVVSAGVLADALTSPVTDWDGRMHWTTQARFVRAARSVDAPVLRGGTYFLSNPRYPLLLPVAQVAALETWDVDDDRAFRPLYAAFLPVSLALIFAAAAPLAGRNAAACAVFTAAVVPALALAGGGAAGAYSDLPLACFGGAALVLLSRRTVSRGEALAAGLLLAGAVLSKTEGFALALAVLAGAAWARRKAGGRAMRALVPAALVAFGAFVFYASWRASISPRFDQGYASILRDAHTWVRAPRRLASAVPAMLHGMGELSDWGWFWWGVPLVILAGRKALRRRDAAPYLVAASGPIALALAAYAVHFDPPALAGSTWTRFLIQVSIPLAAILAACTREAARRSPALAPGPQPFFHANGRTG
jgi:hypothetical protein